MKGSTFPESKEKTMTAVAVNPVAVATVSEKTDAQALKTGCYALREVPAHEHKAAATAESLALKYKMAQITEADKATLIATRTAMRDHATATGWMYLTRITNCKRRNYSYRAPADR